jgi:hypothetical protein
MPYIIKPVDDGVKVCKRDQPSVCFSKKPLTKAKAKKQMAAIGISEAKGGGTASDFPVKFGDNPYSIKDKENYKRITIRSIKTADLDEFRKICLTLLRDQGASTEEQKALSELEYDRTKKPKDLFKDSDWYNMPEFRYSPIFENAPILYMFYLKTSDKAKKFLEALAERASVKITDKTDGIWYPERPEELHYYNDKIYITEEPVDPKYPIYIISKGRWEKRYTSRYLEWAGIPYKIVVEPQEFEKYAEVIDKSKILVLPKAYLGKNQGGIPARNFVLHHSKSTGAKRHWILDDNIKSYKRMIDGNRVVVKSGVVFRIVEDYVDRYSNIMLAGHNYSMFGVSTNLHLRPITRNTRVYSSILINNDIPFEWRGRYNEDTDLSLRVLKAGYPTILFNAILADKLMTLTQKGGNTDSVYAEENALYKKAKSLADQHPDVAEVKERFGRVHHIVNYKPFAGLKPEFKPGVRAKLTDAPNNYGMKLVDEKFSQKNLVGAGRSSDKFMRQLHQLKLSPEAYLEVAKAVAKREGYDPDRLEFALNNDNKLVYDSPEGKRYFGKAGYGDYIIYLYEERNNSVPQGFADKKRRVFRKSHGAMSKKYNLGKYSPNELAINILW